MEYSSLPDNEVKRIAKYSQCYMTYCADVYKTMLIKREEYIAKKEEIAYLFIENKIKKEEYLNRMSVLDEEHFHSDYYKKFASCVIDNCYESSKINLNRLLSKMPDVKYKKTSKYTVDDFINIMKLYYHHFTTLRYIKSKYLRTISKIDKVLSK